MFDIFGDIEVVWTLVRLFIVLMIFGFVRNWTGNTTMALIVGGILAYLFVFKYPALGVGYLLISNLAIIIFVLWLFFMIVPK